MKQQPSLSTRFVRCLLAFTLAVGLMPALAFADDVPSGTGIVEQFAANTQSGLDRVKETGKISELADSSVYNFADGAVSLAATDLPAKYDLRDKGFVTPVKLQNPWGTCWGFGAIAAAESSILAETGMAADELDLSELQLAWFAYKALPADDPSSQAGEGPYVVSSDPNAGLDLGGFPFTATSVFSSGVGPISEDIAPYRNKEGITFNDEEGNPICYSNEGDWSVSEDKRFLQQYELEESAVLPSPATRDAETQEYVYSEAGTQAVKQELMAGRGVEIAFLADQSMPGDELTAKYLNPKTWAHYTYDDEEANHAVTIVGWDDAYSKDNFLEAHQPPADGAWIVKNSWGAETNEFPHKSDWGVDGSGYFYLSYYDRSISALETFDFDTTGEPDEAGSYYLVNQYDYLPSMAVNATYNAEPVYMANVFTAEENQMVRSLSTETAAPGTKVVYELYVLNDEWTSPRDGDLAATVTETYEYGGYHRVNLAEGVPMEEGQEFAIVVTQTVDNTYAVLVDTALNKKGYDAHKAQGIDEGFYSVGIVNRGESYLFDDGIWDDWSDTIKEIQASSKDGDWVDYDNFAIKAYADPMGVPERFSDVAKTDWFYDVVNYVADRSIMKGYAGDSTFGPYNELNRQDLACLLFNYLEPTEAAKWEGDAWKQAEVKTPYVDAQEVAYYTPALNWAYENSVMTGYDDGTNRFGVGNGTSREELASVLWRIGSGIVPGPDANLDAFIDGSSVSSWAVPCMIWCAHMGIITGNNGYLLPQDVATRAEGAKMISVYDQIDLKG